MSSYPKWIFHKTEAPKIVQTKEEHDEVGKGWEETPAAFSKKQDAKIEESTTNQDQTESEEMCTGAELKELNLIAMTVVELKKILTEKGKKESELKGLKKDDLIALIGACK